MNKRSGSSLFLMEMMVVVFFFVLCAGTCVLVFAKSDNLSRLARDTNKSVLVSQSVAECFKAGSLEEFVADMGGESDGAGNFRIPYDRDWKSSGSGKDWTFLAEARVEADGRMERAAITVIRASDSKVLYQLEVSGYRSKD